MSSNMAVRSAVIRNKGEQSSEYSDEEKTGQFSSGTARSSRSRYTTGVILAWGTTVTNQTNRLRKYAPVHSDDTAREMELENEHVLGISRGRAGNTQRNTAAPLPALTKRTVQARTVSTGQANAPTLPITRAPDSSQLLFPRQRQKKRSLTLGSLVHRVFEHYRQLNGWWQLAVAAILVAIIVSVGSYAHDAVIYEAGVQSYGPVPTTIIHGQFHLPEYGPNDQEQITATNAHGTLYFVVTSLEPNEVNAPVLFTPIPYTLYGPDASTTPVHMSFVSGAKSELIVTVQSKTVSKTFHFLVSKRGFQLPSNEQ